MKIRAQAYRNGEQHSRSRRYYVWAGKFRHTVELDGSQLVCNCYEFEHGGTCPDVVAVGECLARTAEISTRRYLASVESVDSTETAFGYGCNVPTFDRLEIDVWGDFTWPEAVIEPVESTSETAAVTQTVSALKKQLTARGIGGRWATRASRSAILKALESGQIPGRIVGINRKSERKAA